MTQKSCLFCKIVKREIDAKMVYEDERVFAFEDIKPEAPVHILVIPKRHIEKISDLRDNDVELTGHLILAAKKIAEDKGIANSGYRIVMNCNRDAGQEVFHMHIHLLGGRKLTWPPG